MFWRTTITITNTLFRHMIQKNNIQRCISRLKIIIVKEITLGHKYRWYATTNYQIILSNDYVYIILCITTV